MGERRTRWHERFGDRFPILAMLHLGGADPAERLARAKQEIATLAGGGVDAVIVENYFGEVSDMRPVLEYLAESGLDLAVGVNVLHDLEQAFAFAAEFPVDFIQIDGIAGQLPPDEEEEFARRIAELRASSSAALLGGVRFKYQPVRSGRTEAEDIRIGMERCDAIVVTGTGTGVETEVEKLARFRGVVGPDFPLVVGAGVTEANLGAQMPYVDGAIVGSFLKDNYEDNGIVDPGHVERLVAEARRLAASQPASGAVRFAEEATSESFAPFGRVFALDGLEGAPGVVATSGDAWTDAHTADPLITRQGCLGRTVGGAAPWAVRTMERHRATEEAIMPIADPVVLTVAPAGVGDAPGAEEVRAFVIRPGTVVVMDPGVWHDACRGLRAPVPYYWFAACRDAGNSPWTPVAGDPVRVAFGGEEAE